MLIKSLLIVFCVSPLTSTLAEERIYVWPKHAPGETSLAEGELQPFRSNEKPPVERVEKIRRPVLNVYPASQPNGTAILAIPGGGFGKVVPNKEGSEAAKWLNELGITLFVLKYRTSEVRPDGEPLWKRPLQDAQRSLRIIRARATEWSINPDRIGVLGFSAGGQVGAVLHTAEENAAYESLDVIDQHSCKPNFSLLIYPWKILDGNSELIAPIQVQRTTPPAFLVHTHDDRSSSVGSVLIYAQLRKLGIPAELHVYQNGGHGYGMRAVPGSDVGSWPERATTWLRLNRWADRADD